MSALFGSRMNYLRRVRVIPSRWFLLLIILTALAPRCLSQKPGHGGSTFRLSELVGSGSRNRSGQLLRRQTITSFRHQLYFEIVNGNPNST
jgi:hypothetical protein